MVGEWYLKPSAAVINMLVVCVVFLRQRESVSRVRVVCWLFTNANSMSFVILIWICVSFKNVFIAYTVL